MKIMVTGGAGFIGCAVVRHLLARTDCEIVNVDKLAFPGSRATLEQFDGERRHRFARADICDGAAVAGLLASERPDAIMHLAAESHVDRSIDRPADFIQSNIVGTYTLLDAALEYWRGGSAGWRDRFRFHHVSTDEVFGSLDLDDPASREEDRYRPNSPYAASKAASDHLARAWQRTYGLPVVLSNCSNNYGPYQFPEKLIPLAIGKAVAGEPIPLYGDGTNVRDWLFVDDHADALHRILTAGRPGGRYNVGGDCELENRELLRRLCALLDELRPDDPVVPHHRLVTPVSDRPGHDRRYAIDASRMRDELGWRPATGFAEGLRRTVQWYLDNEAWSDAVTENTYRGERLGLAG